VLRDGAVKEGRIAEHSRETLADRLRELDTVRTGSSDRGCCEGGSQNTAGYFQAGKAAARSVEQRTAIAAGAHVGKERPADACTEHAFVKDWNAVI